MRARVDSDVDACVELLSEVRANDGYPAHWPSDARRFMSPPYERASWVADDEGTLVGHVSLHVAETDPVCEAASSVTGLPARPLVVIARLLVAPTARRRGIGRQLINLATNAAHCSRQRPVLDVASSLPGAIAFYEAVGWTPAGIVTLTFRTGPPLNSRVYVGPAPR
jgi:GNAT superfamily N-acetyltransferase